MRRKRTRLIRGAGLVRLLIPALGILGVISLGASWWMKRESGPPQAKLTRPLAVLGRSTPIDIEVTASRPGLRSVRVALRGASASHDLFSEEYPPTGWRGSLLTQKQLRIEPDLENLKVAEGKFRLEVTVETYAWHLLGPGTDPVLSVPVTVDLSPPLVAPVTTEHNLRLGGVDLAVWRVSPDSVSTAIEVGPYSFAGVLGYFSDPGLALGFFAVPQDLDTHAQPRLVALDGAGNRREVPLPVSIQPRSFSDREIVIDDDFLLRKVPDLEQLNGLPHESDPVQGYLRINRELRRQNEVRIREVTSHSAPKPLWDGPFLRQSNAASLSSFADRRNYKYRNEVIDHQTHLGYDLASLKQAAVEAAQTGIVVLAGNLGIYGKTVILDHGLGVFTLYGHLSTIGVKEGDSVRARQVLGQTGETGLASGDHLHFSVMLRGQHVDPVEWWDPHWLKVHVNGKLVLFPRAAAKSESHAPSQP